MAYRLVFIREFGIRGEPIRFLARRHGRKRARGAAPIVAEVPDLRLIPWEVRDQARAVLRAFLKGNEND
jgi:hypothetical protein